MKVYSYSQRIVSTLLPEWSNQNAVLLSWPHEESDWKYMLEEVRSCFEKLALAILSRERLLLVCPNVEELPPSLTPYLGKGLCVVEMPTNDTWARDFGPLSLSDERGRMSLVDFGFNAWGMKFAACHDNMICRRLASIPFLWEDNVSMSTKLNFFLEGGAIETDGRRHILTTASCLFEPNRNPQLRAEEIAAEVAKSLGAEKLFVLEYGALEGDDTDGHIDTLARFCDEKTIAYVAPPDEADSHYADLSKMQEELSGLLPYGYRLIPLPMAEPIYDRGGCRLPATYANFLIMNDAVLYPTYASERDREAEATLRLCFPGKELIGVDCRALIRQHGSLHCVTMQFPVGLLRQDLPAVVKAL
ncbi:hypothetical protein HQ45_06400 [Porphyromonas crevioricanis]|uniref:agmatine deiminase family protein n=1 Tax=Porphyromonas crevioricanis TaxID=393921 RepID=UPI00052DB544|nr:agmatine deiminase family protein [Porphyromonas crevioricanis]KGN89630.1 hypothetical protein HQ45_06400 [Porphyromonas crevioricanis]